MNDLKTGIWGYKKESVYNYIVSLEEEAARKMAQRDLEAEEVKQEYEKRVAELEKELETVRAKQAVESKKQTDKVEESGE
jgi:hypothetical protein